jgi:glycosyltransferase involved in cell wall biosynthesis
MLVSIICPILNEEKYIVNTLASFLQQKHTGFDIEILLVDGMSTDKTREIISTYLAENPRLRLLDNEKRKTPFAFNIGLENASGEYIVLMGAHCIYEDDYVETCYHELVRTQSVGCSGRVIPTNLNNHLQSKLVSMLLSNSFGVSGNSFRTIKEGYVHSVNFPIFKKSVLLEFGGYDIEMHRNQDNAMNQKIIAKGYKLYCTWKTSCNYFIPDTLQKILRYAYMNGFWNVKTHAKFPGSMKFYHFIPFFFVIGLIILILAASMEMVIWGSCNFWVLLLSIIGLHLIVGFTASINTFLKTKKPEALLLAPIFFIFHFCYGYGSLLGFLKQNP